MDAGAWASVASAVIALFAMVGSFVGWWLARGEKVAAAGQAERAVLASEAAAGHALRSADAEERIAAATEANARAIAQQVDAVESKPWDLQPGPGSNTLLVNMTAVPKYGVTVRGAMVRKDDLGDVDGYGIVELDTLRGVGGMDRNAVINWYRSADGSGERLEQRRELP